MNDKKKRLWNPKARKCSGCPELKPIKDKQTQEIDPNKKFCQRFSWEITIGQDKDHPGLAEKQAVCRIEVSRKKRRHR